MNMKRLLTLVAFFATLHASAQQVNPVPDYVFRNQMSVGRNAVTDTAAYFSIGPRYGATKGFMPPIVGDTATFSSGKRNGLLIFSVQKNKFLYWDSVRVQWSDMAGSSGAYIVAGDTAAMLAPYLRKADTTAMLSPYFRKADTATLSNRINLKLNISDTSSMLGNYVRHAGYGLTKSGQSFIVDTLNIATRAWRQKGLDSLAALEVSGSGTTNYVPKFTAASTIGNSQIFDNGTNVGIGTTSPTAKLTIVGAGAQTILNSGTTADARMEFHYNSGREGFISWDTDNLRLQADAGNYLTFFSNATERLRIFANGRVFVGASPTDAGYQFDVNGTFRASGGSALSTSVFSNTGFDGGIDVANTGTLAANRTAQVRLFNGPTSFGANDRTYQMVNIGESPTAAALLFQYWNGSTYSERFRINSSGDVGINQASPSYKLDVNGTLRSVNGANFATTSGNVGIGTASPANNGANTTTLTINGTNQGILQLQNAGTKYFELYASGTDTRFENVAGNDLTFRNGSTVNARITSGGNVGIGTASPAAKFHVVDGANFEIARFNGTSTGSYIALQEGGLERSYIEWGLTETSNPSGNYLGLYNAEAGGGIRLATKQSGGTINSTALIVNSNAETLINTSTDVGDYKLQVSGNIYNTGSAVLAATSGSVGIGVTPTSVLHLRASSATFTIDDSGDGTSKISFRPSAASYAERAFLSVNYGTAEMRLAAGASGGAYFQSFYTNGAERARFNAAGEFIIDASGTDAGDYKLQVVGNARVGTGKLDIASNTTFGLGIARSGTSEVAGQIYNSNGILYLGAESSAGGQIFSGSAAYAGVIGTGANYPLQFAVNNITRGGFSTSGNLLLGFTTDSYFLKLQVNGSIFSNNQFFGQGANAQLSIDSSANISPLYVSAHSLTGTSAQAMLYSSTTWNTTGNPSLLDLNITNTASGATSNYIKITDGTNTFRVTKAAEVVTAAPTGGSIRKWKLGEAATVSPTSPNRTIRVEIDGTVYYLHAKTTND